MIQVFKIIKELIKKLKSENLIPASWEQRALLGLFLWVGGLSVIFLLMVPLSFIFNSQVFLLGWFFGLPIFIAAMLIGYLYKEALASNR